MDGKTADEKVLPLHAITTDELGLLIPSVKQAFGSEGSSTNASASSSPSGAISTVLPSVELEILNFCK